MKILLVNTMDIFGGAAIATYRLHKELLDNGIDSTILAKFKDGHDDTVISTHSKLRKLINKVTLNLDRFPLKFIKGVQKDEMSLSFMPSSTIKKINKSDADIVHLNWICGAFIRIEDLKRIKKRIVWTQHDMWAFTGGEHYVSPLDTRYVTGYTRNNRPGHETGIDLNKWVWKRKFNTFRHITNMTIVTPSNWLGDCTRNSFLLKKYKTVVIPNGIDLNKYKPIEKKIAREILNIPENKKLILTGAVNIGSCKRKGFYLLDDAITELSQLGIQDTEIVIFGAQGRPNFSNNSFKIHNMYHLYDDISLNVLYSAADVMIVPSEVEAFGLTVLEAIACGTPVVAFNIGGVKDIIVHKQNGYLAEPYDTKSMAKGILWILSLNESEKESMANNCREIAKNNFNISSIANQYIKLYKEILNHENKGTSTN